MLESEQMKFNNFLNGYVLLTFFGDFLHKFISNYVYRYGTYEDVKLSIDEFV